MAGPVHSALVLAAAAWLRARRCTVVITDMVSGAGETADAIGFNSYRSTLIECKASRADFRVDQKKLWRYEGGGIGNERFYLAPVGLLKAEEMPTGWGLLEMKPNGSVRMQKDAESRSCQKDREVSLLISAIRRIGRNPPDGISVKAYTIETERTATIGILPDPIE